MNASKLKPRRLLAVAVLGLLLLFGQQHATRHWLSHAIDATHAKAPGSVPQPHCDACDGLAAFGAAMPAPLVVLPPAPAPIEGVELPTRSV
ncbi:MAG: hypothetical protein M3Y32_08060, partial [Pseudomonadota bacterium]|nr:hypothetical protein [Pseudomonadota bacterium]